MIRNRQGQSLWQLRDEGIAEFPGQWGLFGGGIEPGESPQQAIQRELKEELNLELAQPLVLLQTIVLERWILHCFYVNLPGGLQGLQLHEGQDWGFFDDDEVATHWLRSPSLQEDRGICPPLTEVWHQVQPLLPQP